MCAAHLGGIGCSIGWISRMMCQRVYKNKALKIMKRFWQDREVLHFLTFFTFFIFLPGKYSMFWIGSWNVAWSYRALAI